MNRYAASLTLLITLAFNSYGHEASTAYLYWQEDDANKLRLDIALTDVALHLLPTTPEALSWQALQNQSSAVARQLQEGLFIRQAASPCELHTVLKGLTDYETETFSSWQIHWQCAESASLLKPITLDYTLLFAKDSLHRAVLTRTHTGIGSAPVEILLLKPESPQVSLTRPLWQTPAAWLLSSAFLGLGLWGWSRWRSSGN